MSDRIRCGQPLSATSRWRTGSCIWWPAWIGTRAASWPGGVSNTFDSDFCVEALEDALTRYGPPEIFNTDQGAQFKQDVVTELVWKPRGDEIVLEVEQLPTRSEVLTEGARYLHAILDRREERFVHLDGAIRWYSRKELETRSDTRLDKSGAVGIRTKIFRLDEPLERGEALDILCAFFVWNYDLAAYLDPSARTARLSHNTAVVLSGDED